MSNGKALKFQFAIDEASFARVKRSVTELTKQFQALGKAMNGGVMSGANVGSGSGMPSAFQSLTKSVGQNSGVKSPLGQAILGDVSAFEKLAKSGTSGMNAMTEAVRRSVSAQIREVDRLEQKLGVLQARFAKDPRAAYEGPFRDNLMAQMVTRQGQITTAQGGLNQLQQVQAALGGGAGGGGLGAVLNSGALGAVLKVGAVAGAGLAVANFAAKEYMAGSKTFGNEEEKRSNLVMGEYARLRNGDVTGLVAQAMMRRDSSRRADLDTQTGKAATALGWLDSGVAFFQKAATLGAAGPDGALLDPFSTSYRNTSLAQKDLEMRQQYERSMEFAETKRAMATFYAEHDARRHAGRVLGVGGNLVYDANGNPVGGKDSYKALDARLTAAGYSVGDYMGAYVGAMSGGGRAFANTNASRIMAAQSAGYGGYGEMLLRASQQGANPLFALGGKDPSIGIALGNALYGYNPMVNQTKDVGLLGAIQKTFDTGSSTTPARAMAGLALGDQISTGPDPRRLGLNTVFAVNNAPDMAPQGQDYLARMSFRNLLNAVKGDLDPEFRNWGGTAEIARNQINDELSSELAMFADTGAGDAVSRSIRAYRSSGKNPLDFLQNASADEQSGLATWLASKRGIGTEAGQSYLDLLRGLGADPTAGKNPAGGRGQLEKTQDEVNAANKQKDQTALEAAMVQIAAAMKQMGAATQVYQTFGSDLNQDVDAFKGALNRLTDEINNATVRLGGTVPKKATSSSGSSGATPGPYAPPKSWW